MSTYTPDRWVVIEIAHPNQETGKLEVHRRVFAGWYGGYCGSDSWRMNSGITLTREFDDRYEFDGASGSAYVCYKSAYGMSGYQQHVLSSYQKDIAESGGTIVVVEDEYA